MAKWPVAAVGLTASGDHSFQKYEYYSYLLVSSNASISPREESGDVSLSGKKSAPLGLREREMLQNAKAVLLDWDGCIAVGNRVLPFARTLIEQYADRIAIVSNNSTHLPGDFEQILAQQDLHVHRDRIFLAGAEAVRFVAADTESRVLLVAVPRIRNYARDLGVTLVNQNPAIVLLMRDARFTYAKLERVANYIRAGARLMVANTDLTHPGPDNNVVPETGALLAAILACTEGVEVSREIIGKPATFLFEQACAFLGVSPDQAVMIGDNPATDGEGAYNAGIRPILIGGASRLGLEHLVGSAAA